MNTDLPTTVDVLVVGGGPAGLSAATWLGRYQRSTLVIDAGQHRNRFADFAHGLLGRDPITPEALLAEARAGLEQYPQVLLRHGTVNAVHRDEDGRFCATVDGTHRVTAARLVLATGVRDRFPRIAGFDDHYGTDIHHCPACDGLTARDQDVIVLGAGAHVPAYASELLDWARTVRLVTDTEHPTFDRTQCRTLDEHGIEIVVGTAEALVGNPGALQGLRLADGTVVEGSKIFFSYAHVPTNSLAAQLGCDLDDEGQIIVDGFQLTSVDGIYATGDITPGLQLVPIAIGQGASAGIACATSLRGHATSEDVPTPAPPARRFTAG
ncbi:NAD(P)/FAD-dependent oxidoreductase [Corynebacterium halotolerans]|uniref:FAD/NAD(P)-binding domain-containing protein n=1 Tax=Corynebacterium halotolerans YIM 70093 = DSM 44683 TaxID=1121362 RepID=M1NPG8_9CORY|nr:NAD(P)/FAD-dependent oxidoreductase [Corynebacterium halotolerans]AGF73283.1 hypothetical protein A605_11425 [Corynebacterium halotolerans YIM 70093 = DSM 44683]